MRSLHEWIVKGSISKRLADERGYKELVRCKDCKFPQELLFPLPTGETIKCNGRYHEPEWYCADGKRRDGDGE